MSYASKYIQRALYTVAPLETPDKEQAKELYEVLKSIHDAYLTGGMPAVQMVWKTLKVHRPEIAGLEKRKLIHADELKNLSMPIYLLSYYPIYLGGFNVLAGASGGGKSFVALDISGRIAVKSDVVYIAGEGLHGYAARWEAWKDYNKMPTARLHFYTEAVQVMDENELNEFIDLIREHKPALVVIDTLARSAVGVEENSAREIGQFVGACDRLRRALDCAVLIVHHTGKDGRIRGSSALYAAADSVIALTSSDGRITLRNDGDGGGKNKHAEAHKPIYLKIIAWNADKFQGAVLMEVENVELTKEDTLTTNQRLILEAIDPYEAGLTAKSIIDATAIRQTTVYDNLKRLLKINYLKLIEDKYVLTEDGRRAL